MIKKFTKRFHVSWLVMWFATGIIVGLASAPLILSTSEFRPWMAALCTVGVLTALRSKSLYAVVGVLCLGIIFGHARGSIIHQRVADYQQYYGNQVRVYGIIHEDVVSLGDGKQRMQLSSVRIGDQKLLGHVWVQIQSKTTLERSNAVVVSGVLSEGFGVLPAAMYRAELMSIDRNARGDIGRDARDWFADKIRTTIAEPEASLGIGYLVGQRSSLPEELDSQLQLLGLTHVVVASGYNLTILVRFTRRLFTRISKYTAFMTAAAMITGFVLMTGFSPSMSRAALVTAMSLIAWYFGRTIQPLVLLALVGAITAYVNPFFAWGDIGWYLSMLSFAGVMVLAPLLKHYFFGVDAQPGVVTSILIETSSAQIVTLPLIIYIFGQYSPFALFANVLILPFIPFAMLTVFIAGLVVVVVPQASSLIHWPATVVLQYMTRVVDFMAAIPGAVGEFSMGIEALIVSYTFLILICVRLWKKTNHNFGKDNIIL